MSERDQDEQDRPKRRTFNGIAKFYDGKRSIVVEFMPDNTKELDDLALLVSDQHASPTVDRCIMLCQEIGIRARVLVGGQYVGHIFADGSCDKGVQNLFS